MPYLFSILGLGLEIWAEHVQAIFCQYSKDMGFIKLDSVTFLEWIIKDQKIMLAFIYKEKNCKTLRQN